MLITENQLKQLIEATILFSLIKEENDPKKLGNMVANFVMVKSPEITRARDKTEFYKILIKHVNDAADSKGISDPETKKTILRMAAKHLANMGIRPGGGSAEAAGPKLGKMKQEPPKKKGFLSKLFQ